VRPPASPATRFLTRTDPFQTISLGAVPQDPTFRKPFSNGEEGHPSPLGERGVGAGPVQHAFSLPAAFLKVALPAPGSSRRAWVSPDPPRSTSSIPIASPLLGTPRACGRSARNAAPVSARSTAKSSEVRAVRGAIVSPSPVSFPPPVRLEPTASGATSRGRLGRLGQTVDGGNS